METDADREPEERRSFAERSRSRPGASGRAGRPAVHRGENWQDRHWSSRALHRVDELTSHAGAGLTAVAVLVLWAVIGAVTGFPDWWETVLYSVTSSVTLVVVFAIQHTQTRQQLATQRKLDELLRALPDADDRVIAVEEATDGELEALAGRNLEQRERAADQTPR